MARPSGGWSHVDRLPAPQQARRRLRVVLEVLSGSRSVASACAELSIGEARFHELRKQALLSAAEGLCARPPGRPKREPPIDVAEVESLRREVTDLKTALWAAQIREELALTMPHVLKRGSGEKTGRNNRP